jgi:hypothetical protein
LSKLPRNAPSSEADSEYHGTQDDHPERLYVV